MHSTLGDQIGDAASKNPGLARSGTGHHQDRGSGVNDRLPLWFVEPVQQTGPGRRGGRYPSGGRGGEGGKKIRLTHGPITIAASARQALTTAVPNEDAAGGNVVAGVVG